MGTAKNETLILDHLSFSYPEYPGVPSSPVFHDLNLSFPQGHLSLVLGRPESGKTTLSRIIAGLIPRHTGGTLEGRVVVPGTAGSVQAPPDLIEHLGIVFQDADEQIVMTRCDYEVAFALESLGLPREDIQRRISKAFELMGLEGFEARNPAGLSGGEKKKLLVSALAALDPGIWILDETLEELDMPTRKRLLEFLFAGRYGVIVFASRGSGKLDGYFSSFSLLSSGGSVGPVGNPDEESILDAARQDGLFLEPVAVGEESPSMSGRSRGEPVLSVEDIRFTYPGKGSFSLSIDGFTLHRGETVCLVGRNGCGKSTLGKILCGLIKPESGNIEITERGGRSKRADIKDLNHHVGYMFQNPDYQIFLPTVRDELMYGLESGITVEDALREAAELFSLHRLDAPPALLSYGTRKRLQAACYYLLRRPVYILDEADSGLSYGDFRKILNNLAGPEHGVLVITHDIDLARATADRIIFMQNGRLVSRYTRGNFGKLGDLED